MTDKEKQNLEIAYRRGRDEGIKAVRDAIHLVMSEETKKQFLVDLEKAKEEGRLEKNITT